MERFCGLWLFREYTGPCFWRNEDGTANLTRLIPASAGEALFECRAAGCATCVGNRYCIPGIEGRECPDGHECIEAGSLKISGEPPPLTPMCVLRQVFDSYWYQKTVDQLAAADPDAGMLGPFENLNAAIQDITFDSKIPQKIIFSTSAATGYVDDLYMHVRSSPDESSNRTGIYYVTAAEPYGSDERQGEIWIVLDVDTSEEHMEGVHYSGWAESGGCSSDFSGKIPTSGEHLYYRIRLQPYFLGGLADAENNDWRHTGRIMFVIKGMEFLTSLDPEVFATAADVGMRFGCEAANRPWLRSNCFPSDPEKTILERLNTQVREKIGDRLLGVMSELYQVLLLSPVLAYPLFGQRCYPDAYYWDTYRENVPNALALAGGLENPGGFQVIYRGRGRTCDPFYFDAYEAQLPLDIYSPSAACMQQQVGCLEIEHDDEAPQ
jgi:hypothetical protein